MTRKHNPHDLIELIDKPKKWRARASIVLIDTYDSVQRQKWREAAILALLVAMFAVVLGKSFL